MSSIAEIEVKPETVWPQTSTITASAATPDSNLVALGLQNGLVTVWDKLLCTYIIYYTYTLTGY